MNDTAKSGRRQIEITDTRHIYELGRFHALGELVQTLKEHETNTPGYHLALARVEKAFVESRISASERALRAAARAGFDLDEVGGVLSGLEGGRFFMEIEPAAEGAETRA